MSGRRKSREESTGTREAILDAAEAIMVEEGYSAVTSRRVEEKAGLKSQLVHYHFGSMDDLFVAVYERSAEVFMQRHLQAASSENPIRALWELSINPQRTRLAREFMALSNHRESIRTITQRVIEQTHLLNVAYISKYVAKSGLDPEIYPPVVISHVISGLSRSLINEEVMGVTFGHAELLDFAARWLGVLETKGGSDASSHQECRKAAE